MRAVGALSVPHLGPPQRPFTDVISEIFTSRGKFFYQAWFQKAQLPEDEAEKDPRDFLRKFYYALSGDAPDGTWPSNKTAEMSLLEGLVDPEVFPAWLTPADLDYYVGEFTRSGFFGPLSRYRNHTRDWRFLQPYKDRKIEQPAFFIAGDRDGAFTAFGMAQDPIATLRQQVPNLEGAHVLEGCGHWTQQERPADVNALLVPWLSSLKGRVV